MVTVFYGSLITPTAASLSSYSAFPKALLCVSHDTGIIQWIEEDVPSHAVQEALAKYGIVGEDIQLVELKTGEFLLPGFIDTHTVRTITSSSPVKLVNITLNRSACTAAPKYWKVGCHFFQRLYSYAHTRHSGQEHELLDWLAKVTFPTEARFEDVAFARKSYTSAVRRIIDNGVRSVSPLTPTRSFRLLNNVFIDDHLLLLWYSSS